MPEGTICINMPFSLFWFVMGVGASWVAMIVMGIIVYKKGGKQ